VRRKEAVLAEAQNLIQEHLDIEDLSLLKARHPIVHERQMVIWRYQMQGMSRQIGDYFRQNDSIVGMIPKGVKTPMAFLQETIETYYLTSEECNSTSTGSDLA